MLNLPDGLGQRLFDDLCDRGCIPGSITLMWSHCHQIPRTSARPAHQSEALPYPVLDELP